MSNRQVMPVIRFSRGKKAAQKEMARMSFNESGKMAPLNQALAGMASKS
jgi:hypothetical protein